MDELSVRDPHPADPQDTQFFLPQGRGCPRQVPAGHARLRGFSPLGRVTWHDGRPVWAVTGPGLARELLTDARLSCERTWPGFAAPGGQFAAAGARGVPLVCVEGAECEARCRLLSPLFTARRAALMRPRILRIVDQLLDSMERQGPPAELASTFALPVSSRVICTVLGVPEIDHEFFEERTERLLSGQSVQEAALARAELEKYLGELTGHRRRVAGEGLLGDLMRPDTPSGPLSREELTALAGMLWAGHETTAGMISRGVFTLLRHPEQLAAVRAGETTMDAVVGELLGHRPVPDGLLRVAVEDIEVAGHTIRAGEGVLFMTAVIDRDGSGFAQPAPLDRDGFVGRHLAFGFGARPCPGQDLARVQLEIALGRLFERLPGLRLAGRAKEIRSRPAALRVEGLLELPVGW